MAKILDGKIIKEEGLQRLKGEIAKLSTKPMLAIIQIGNRPDSAAYIRQKKKFGAAVGVDVWHIKLSEDVLEEQVLREIDVLNMDKTVDGILVQIPFPAHLNKDLIINRIVPQKDVDGLSDVNVAKLEANDESGFVPATSKGILTMLDHYGIPLRGVAVTMLGRSALVGKPTAQALKNRGAIVTVCHSQTPNTQEIARKSDIVVVAIGKPKFITKDYVSPGQVIIDVGINVAEKKLEEEIGKPGMVGDVDFDTVKDGVAAISPVPGGVGQVTVLSLFENVLKAHLLANK